MNGGVFPNASQIFLYSCMFILGVVVLDPIELFAVCCHC